MKIKSVFTLCLVLVSGIVCYGQGFNPIKGKVIDPQENYPLFGATVVLKDGSGNTIIGVVTNEFGNFDIRTNASGKATVVISYIGFENKSFEVDLGANEINLGTILMNSSSMELEQVVVTGSLEGKTKALNQQRTSDNIKNIVSADLIGRFPDLNVAEALQRIPGINIQRDKGEGATISIRGTPQYFTTIQINGEQIPSVQQGGSRNEALDLIPADQLASMEITKAPTPDMDGDAIGGVVNLRTPVARKFGLGIRAETAVGYNDISGDMNGINKLRVDKRFFKSEKVSEGKLGMIIGGSHYQSNNSEDRVDANWFARDREDPVLLMENYQYRNTVNLRTRLGITGSLDYKFNDDHQIVFNYMFNKREDNDIRNRLRFDFDRSGSVYQSLDSISDGRIRRDINLFDEVKENQSFNLQGYHKLGSWQVDWGAYYTKSERMFTSDRGDFARDEIDIVADNLGGIYTDVPNFRPAAGEQSMYDPFLYSDFRRYEEDFETTEADNIVGKIDLLKNINFLGKYAGYLKFGGKYRTQSNSKFRDNNVFAFNDPNNLINTEEAFLRSLSGKEPDSFLYSDYRFGPLIGKEPFQEYIASNRRLLATANDAWDSRRLSLNDTYDAQEDIAAAYVMGKVQFNKLMVLAGLRYEQTKVDYDAFEVFRVGTDVQGSPIQGGNNFNFLLPNVHFKYNIDEFTALRFSTVFNYARPNFVDIVPFVNFDADAITLTLGNPDLLPASSMNLDLMFEKYFANVGVLSLGIFYKDIDDFQFSRIDPFLLNDFPGYPSTQGFRFRQEQNGDNAKVVGVELNFLKGLDFLPGFLKYLNIDGNYTYTFSDAFTQDRDGIALPGQADHTFNTALSGDFGNFTGQISANYNGTFVSSLASQEQDDIYQLERLQLDANASYQFNKNWRVFTEFTNLTNEPSIRYQGSRERISRIAYFGWQARIGVSYRL